MPFRIGKPLVYATVIWMTGFIWGTIVFMTPSLTRQPIPYVSSNPGISFPLLFLWPILVYPLALSVLNSAAEESSQGLNGLKLGLIFSGVNLLLDLVVLVILLKAGVGYFASLTVWIAYGLLLIIPWLTGRFQEKAAG